MGVRYLTPWGYLTVLTPGYDCLLVRVPLG